MIDDLVTHTLVLARCLTTRIRQRLHSADPHRDRGSTLELVIITLGLMGLAGLLLAAITGAVKSRTAQIK
ncbi:MAG TPA: hypothetical protein VHN80_23400 [Kineosporiaceae bacterium]|jgi:hypothetical protein|nr:hypothetical protein [Kineosporiaceae bacterium]